MSLLRYCAWCGKYQGNTPAEGVQIRPNVCEIDTATICATCLEKVRRESPRRRLPHS